MCKVTPVGGGNHRIGGVSPGSNVKEITKTKHGICKFRGEQGSRSPGVGGDCREWGSVKGRAWETCRKSQNSYHLKRHFGKIIPC